MIQLYKLIYNYSIKKDEYSKVLPFLCSALLALGIFIVLLGILSIWGLVLNSPYLYIRNFNKGIALILILAFCVAFYAFLFHVLNFPRQGENQDHTFNISPREAQFVKFTFICTLIIASAAIALYIGIVTAVG